MTTISDAVEPAVTLANHLGPIAISVMLLLMVVAVILCGRQLQYIALVADATDDEGVDELAKYMARRNGGKHIDTTNLWESFVPAAKAVSDNYHSN